ncbi:MAG TPA: hypothetical protein DCL77_10400, partial [Prolixibacteraceae bacterium]|nr:hypothetical protein [Prolixibacteraceae bacterium]
IGDGINNVVKYSGDDKTKHKILEELQESFSEKQTYLKSGSNPIGVIQNGFCSTDKHLEVYMDCEDGANNSSITGNWTGNISVSDGGNIYYNFCIVDGSMLNRTNFDYAVLDLSGNIPTGAIAVTRLFDNEDSYNKNYVKVNNILISGTYGGCNFGKNTYLGFQFFPALANSQYTLPDFSIGSYGVFGRFGNEQGTVFSDDENSGNANALSFTVQTPETDGIPNTVEATGTWGQNTTLHISRAF